MKSKTIRNTFVLLAFCAMAISFSSCNRGYGCPQWSVNDQAVDAVKAVVELVAH